MKKLMTAILAVSILTTSGCAAMLTGAGEVGLGFRSESKLFAYHTVDGDKQDVESKSELDLEALLDLFLKAQASEASGSE